MAAIEAVLVGAGQRGREVFGAFALAFPHRLKFVAVADPNEERRRDFAARHGIAPERCFASWQELVAAGRLAPLCVNATMDREHAASSLAFLEAGYHLLLEKPMAHTPEGCLAILRAARQRRRIVQICHPLRYTVFYAKVKELLDGGRIGEPLVVQMAENVAYWHFAHSFVRGNWRRCDESGPLVLTKTCHDMDLAAWLVGKPVRRLASVGERRLFRPERAPAGAPERCLDGCPAETSCPFYAPAMYLSEFVGWPVSAISLDRSLEARRRALEEGPYGRCVYRCDNDVVDHQLVCAEFVGGTMLDFSVSAATTQPYRSIRIIGTQGELHGHFERQEIRVERFVQGVWPRIPTETHHVVAPAASAHGGGDAGVIDHVLRILAHDDYDVAERSLEIAVEGHLLAFAAEQARQRAGFVDFAAYREEVEQRSQQLESHRGGAASSA